MYRYSEKGFFGITIDSDFSDNTTSVDIFTAVNGLYLYNALDGEFWNAMFESIKTELTESYFFLYSEQEYDDVTVLKLLKNKFVQNIVRAMNKHYNLIELFKQRATLLSSFGNTSVTATDSSSIVGARVGVSKINETPQSGNIDVNSDTYLSSITKNTAETATDTASIDQTTTSKDNENLLKFLNTEVNNQFQSFREMLLNNCEVF